MKKIKTVSPKFSISIHILQYQGIIQPVAIQRVSMTKWFVSIAVIMYHTWGSRQSIIFSSAAAIVISEFFCCKGETITNGAHKTNKVREIKGYAKILLKNIISRSSAEFLCTHVRTLVLWWGGGVFGMSKQSRNLDDHYYFWLIFFWRQQKK